MAYRVLAPAEVVDEISEPNQREGLSGALARGYLEQVVVDTMESLQLFAELRDVIGKGEAACLTFAATRGAHCFGREEALSTACRGADRRGARRANRGDSPGRNPTRAHLGCRGRLLQDSAPCPFGNFSELLWLLGRHRGSIGIGAARP